MSPNEVICKLPSDTEILMTVWYPHAVEKVYRAMSEPEHVKRWFCPMDCPVKIDAWDFRVGGKYDLTMQMDDGDHQVVGEFVELVTDRTLSMSFYWTVSETMRTPSLVTFTYAEKDGGTELTMHHSKLPGIESRDAHNEGWTLAMGRLGQALQTME